MKLLIEKQILCKERYYFFSLLYTLINHFVRYRV